MGPGISVFHVLVSRTLYEQQLPKHQSILVKVLADNTITVGEPALHYYIVTGILILLGFYLQTSV